MAGERAGALPACPKRKSAAAPRHGASLHTLPRGSELLFARGRAAHRAARAATAVVFLQVLDLRLLLGREHGFHFLAQVLAEADGLFAVLESDLAHLRALVLGQAEHLGAALALVLHLHHLAAHRVVAHLPGIRTRMP